MESQKVVQGEVDQEQVSLDWSTQETGTGSSQEYLTEYNLTRDRERRTVKAPTRYGYADYLA